MRKVSTALILLLAVVDVCRCDRDSCDIDDPTLKKLCRKVESQEKYQEKWVATNFKAEMVIMLNSNFVNDRLFPFFFLLNVLVVLFVVLMLLFTGWLYRCFDGTMQTKTG